MHRGYDKPVSKEDEEERKRKYREKLQKAGWGKGKETLDEMSKPYKQPAFEKLKDFLKRKSK